MTATTTPTATAPHVPAWKRIGLKLKYAKDIVDDQIGKSSTSTINASPKQHNLKRPTKRAREDIAPETPAKRPKPASYPTKGSQFSPLEHSSRPPPTNPAYRGALPDEQAERPKLPPPAGVFKAPNQAPTRTVFSEDEEGFSEPLAAEKVSSGPGQRATLRKSVSFTPDTKAQDGFSAHKLFKAWAAGEDPAELASESARDQLVDQPSPSKTQKEKKPKKPKSAKKTATPTTNNATPDEESEGPFEGTPNCVHYLEQFHTDRSNWKFNKNRQNDLFNNLFNLSRIPKKYNDAIIEYVAGVQGQARQRVSEQAEEVLKALWVKENGGEDSMSIDSAAARRAAYYAALSSAHRNYQAAATERDQHSDRELSAMMKEYEAAERAGDILQRAFRGEIIPTAQSSVQSKPSQSQSRQAAAPSNSLLSSTIIPRATRVTETTKTGRGAYETQEMDITSSKPVTKRKRNRKSRTEVSDSSSSESEESELAATGNPSKSSAAQKGTGGLFSSSLLDKKFGKAI